MNSKSNTHQVGARSLTAWLRPNNQAWLPVLACVALMTLVWLPFSGHAGNLYWDANGATAGAGGATPTGTWGTDNFWTTSSAGTLATIAWTAGETVVFSAGTDATGTFTVNVNGTQSAGGILVEEGLLSLSGGTISLSSGASVQVGASRSLTIASIISGSGWTKAGGGSLSLNSANSFTGPLTLTGSAVRFNNNGAAGFGSIIVTPTSDVFLQSSVGGVTLTNPIVLNSGQNVDVSAQTGSLTLNGDISGGRSLWSVGGQAANTVVLGGNNTFSGNVKISGGTLIVTRDSTLGTVGGTTEVSSGATLGLQGGFSYNAAEVIKLFGDGVGTLGAIKNISGVNQFFGPIDLQSSVTIGAVSGSLDLGGTISGAPYAVTKVGSGRIIISGLGNNFNQTAVNAGTLQVESTLGSGTVTVSAGATLAGNGVISGTVALSGEVSPASSPGSLSTGSETWNPDASYLWEINEADFGMAGDSVGWDLVDISGTLTINSTMVNPFVVRLASLDPFFNLPNDAGDFDETVDYAFPIAKTTGGVLGFNANKFVLNESLFSNFKGVGKFVVELANANNDLVLKFIHPAFITSEPVSVTKQCGVETATFSVGAGGTGLLSYQWSSNGVPLVNDARITGATSSTLSISPVHLADSANYTCLITNVYGSTNSAVAVLTVIDTLAPALTCPPNVPVVADTGVCFATGVSLGTALAPDSCDASPVITNNAAALYSLGYPVGTNIVTWGATDGSGNHSECQQRVIVTDNQLPLVAANPITRQLDNAGNYTLSAADINAITSGSSDNCGIASTNLNPTVFNFCNVGMNNVSVTLTDLHGNVSNRVAVVTITAPNTPTVVYVDDDYPVTCAAVNFPSNGLPGPYYVGFNAFKTIQAGINAVASGGTVNVAAGTYTEDVNVNKPLSLIGPNANINPNTGSRVPEAIVIPATSDPDPYSPTSEIVIYVSTSNVTIKGFTVDGDNASSVSGITNLVAGPDVDAAEGIVSYEGVGSIMISNNIIKNTSYSGVDFYNYFSSAATADNHIQGNKLQNIGHIPYGFGIGVLIYNNFYADVSDNVMTDVRVGIQTGNFEQPNPGSTQSLTRNTIHSTKKGIFHNLHYSGASPLSISNNTISVQNEAGAARWDGIMVSSIQSSVGVVVANNMINATPVAQTTVGYQLWNDPTTLGVTVTGGTVSGANYGVWLNNYDGYGPGNGDSTTLTLSGVTITNASLAGVYVKDNPLNSNGATVHAVLNGSTVIGSAIGLLVDGSDASLDPGNTALSNLTGDYIDLVNTSASNMDATSVTFDGLTGAGQTLAQLFATEDRIDHATDTAGLGFVRVKAANVYVTQNSGSIQRGINPATSGDTVNVNDGTYTESLNINKSLLVKSASGFGVTTIGGTSQTAVTVAADYVTLLGFTVTNPGGKWGIYSPNRNHVVIAENRLADIGNTDATPSVSNFGVAIESSSAAVDDIQIVNNVVSNLFGGNFKSAQAIAVGFSGGSFDITGLVIRSNLIAQVTSSTNAFGAGGRGAYGIILNHTTSSSGKTVGAQITENEITDLKGLWAHGIGLEGKTPGAVVQSNILARLIDFKSPSDPDAVAVMVEDNAFAASVAITLNSFTNVWFGVRNVTAFSVNAVSNWWGSASGPAAASNPGGLGMAASVNVNFSPWLGDGTDNSAGIGFQPNFAPVYYQPDHLVFSTQPGNGALNALLSTQPVVQVIDANGGLATQFNGSVTVVIGVNPGGGVLAGTVTVPVVGGIATFTDLSITVGGGSGFTLVASTASPVISTNSATFDIGNPVPVILSMYPFWKRAGDPTFIITVTGTNFVPTSEVLWNGSPRVTTYLSPTTVTASIPAVDILLVGTAAVSVFNPPTAGGTSGSLTFRIEPTPPAIVYVDDGYVGLTNDTLVNWPYTGSGTHIIGYDAFATVQGGVNAVTNTGTVNVAAGTYGESVVANKAVTLLGNNQGIAGCGVRGPASLIAGGSVALDITADGVSVDGFDITGATGLRNLGHETVIVRNNTFTAAAVGVDTEGVAPTAVAGVIVSNNCITLTSQLAGPIPTLGMALFGVSGTASPVIENNNISGAFYGYVLYSANVASLNTVIKGGVVTGVRQGVAVFNIDPITQAAFSPSTFTVDGITMSGFTGATTHAGVNVSTFGPLTSAKITGLIKNLNVSGTGKPEQDSAGIVLADFSTVAGNRQTIAVVECTITNNLNRGVSIRGSNCLASVTRCLVNNNGGDPFGAGGNDGYGIIARNGSQVTVTECYVTNPSAQAGASGVHALAADANTSPEGPSLTVTNSSINNNGNALGKLAEQSAGTLNASGNYWGMTSDTAINALITGVVDFTPYLDSGVDTSAAFAFQGDFSTLRVSAQGAQSGSVARVQEGVDALADGALSGGSRLVLVEAGTYTRTGAGASVVHVNKPATLRGANAGISGDGSRGAESIIDGDSTGENYYVVAIESDDVTIDGFEIKHPIYNSTADASGILVGGGAQLSNIRLANNVIHDIGALARPSAFGTYGINAGPVNGLTVEHNKTYNLANNDLGSEAIGILTWGNDDLDTADNVLIFQNTFSNIGNIAGEAAGVRLAYKTASAVVSSNSITGIARGVVTTPSPAPGALQILSNTIAGPSDIGIWVRSPIGQTVSGNTINGAGTSIYVFDSSATLKGNLASAGSGVGIRVSGATAKALIEGNNLVGDSMAAIQVDSGAIVDAGDCLGGNVTGLGTGSGLNGSSAGGNVITGYGFDNAAPWAIDNQNPSGGPNVLAYNNAFGAVSGDSLDNLMSDVTDSAALSKVLANQSVGLVLSCPTNVILQCLSSVPNSAADLASLVAQGGAVSATVLNSVLSSDTIVSNTPNDRVITRQYTVTDACGQSAVCNQTITVDDTIAPVVTTWPTNRTLNVGGQCNVSVPDLTVEVSPTDNCGAIHLSQSPLAGTLVSLGTTIVTVTVSDDGGNFTNQNTALTIVDTNPAPLATYVDDDYTNLASGTVVTWPYSGGSGTHYIGCDAFATIQGGVNRVASSGTVNVAAGTYSEDVNVNKTVNILGAGAGSSVVIGPIGGAGSTFTFASSGAVLDGFTITRAGNNTTDWNNPGLNTAGVAMQGLTVSGTVRNCLITGMRTAIDINNSGGSFILNNVITNNRTGMIMRNQTDNLVVSENIIGDNWTVGVLFLDASGGTGSPVQQAINCRFTSNSISGNWYGQIVDRQTGGSLPLPGANLKNFSGNWLGTALPVVTAANSAEPGYAVQIPVIFGGSAVPPGGQPDIAGAASGNIDYTPWLDVGTDTSAAFGFQGDFATLHVDDNSPQVGAVTRIQEGVDMVSGSTVLVEPGSYSENVLITKKVTIDGAGSGTGPGDSIVTAANPALPVFLVTDAGGTGAGDRLTIKDLRVTGGSDGIRVNAATGTRQWYRIDNVAAVNNSGSGIALAGVATLGEVQVAGSVLSNNGVYGLQVADTLAAFAGLAISGGSMDNNGAVGLGVNGVDATPASPTQISVTGTTFNGNGSPADAGAGDLSFFRFNGDAAITNVTVTADAQYPIQFRGKGSASPGSWSALGTVRLENVTVSGATTRPGLYIVQYTNVANVSFENVNLSGLVPPLLPSGFASVMQVQHTGLTPLNLHGLTLKTTYVGGPPVGYGALAMLQSGGAIADCTTVILGATTVQQLENSVYDQQDNALVGDVGFPVLTLTPAAPNVIAECTGGGQATVTFADPAVTADCPPPGPVICTPASGSIFVLGTNTVTCTVTDNRGISASTNFAVIVRDTTRPEIASCAPSTNVVADASCQGITPDLTGRVAASDSCGSGALVYTQSPLAGSLIGLGPNLVTLTVTDPSGNFSNCVTTVTVVDQTAPIVTYWPTNRTLSVGGACTVLVPDLTGEPLATDSCSPPIIVTQNPVFGTPVGLGLTTVIVTVADQVGNFTNHNTLLTIVDTSNPAITCPANVAVNRLDPTDPYVTGFATASDNCTNVTITFNDNRSGLTNCNATGDILRTWTATDSASNATTCVQTITLFDTVAPLFTSSQSNLTTTNDLGNCSAVVTFPIMTAVDVGYDQGFENPAWVSASHISAPSVDWNDDASQITRVPSGTDGIVSKTGVAHAVIDSTAIPASPFDYTGAFTRLGGYSSVFGTGYRASLDVYLNLADPAVTTNTYGWDVSTAASDQTGAHRRDFVFHAASDGSGNILIAADNNSNFTRRNDLATVNHHTVTASGWYTLEWVFRDNGSGALAVDCNLRDAGGALLWTETRSDGSDLIATIVGGNRYMWFTFLEVNKLAIDNTHLERNATVVCTPASGTAFSVGTNTVLCVASDACGNTTTNSFTVTVNDVERPTITVSPNLTTTNDVGLCSAVVNYSAPVVADNCGVAGTVQTTGLTNGATFPVGTTVNTFVVTDIHGNTATNSFTVTVNDVQKPQVTAGSIATCYETSALAEAAAIAATSATDNCGVASTNILSTVGTCSAVITVRVTDIHLNFTDVVYNTRIDPTAPVISAAAATEVQIAGTVNVLNNNCLTSPVLQGLVLISVNATDNCSIVGGQPSVTMVNGTNTDSAVFINQSPAGTYNYSWLVTNVTANGTWTVTVAASDLCHNTTTNFTLCVNKSQVTGLVQLEGFIGTGAGVNHSRLVTFVATTNATVLKTWNLTLTNVSGDTFSYTLTDVPAGTTGISAKTAWNLREKLAVVLDINGQAAANFVSDGIFGWSDATDHYLRGGDYTGDNLIQFLDYTVLGNNFFTFNAVADITGDGQVDYDDYFILYLNWFTAGDPQ